MVHKPSTWVQVLYLCLAIIVSVTAAKTRSVDKRALLAFKDLISSDQHLLANWDRTSDPCGNSWSGISCNCSDLPAPLSAVACDKATAGADATVILLNLGAVGSNMKGTLAPELGNLTYLQSLQLDGQAIQVNCPAASAAHKHVLNIRLADVQPCIMALNVSYQMPCLLHLLSCSK